jgi:hypothetical protein
MRRARNVVACVTVTVLCIAWAGATPSGVPYSQMVVMAWDGAQMAHVQDMMAEGKLPELTKVVGEGGMAPTWITTHCTATLAGFAEILCGYPPTITGCYGVQNHRPIQRDLHVFHRLKQHFAGNITTVYIVGKAKRLSVAPGGPHYEARPDMDVCYAERARDNEHVGSLAMKYLDELANPGTNFFYFIHFKEPDCDGHRYGENSAEYEHDMMVLDGWLGQFRAKLQEKGVAGTTAVCVLTDHGFDEGQRTHQYAPDAWMATNWTTMLEGDMRDVAPTILAAYGIDLDQYDPPLPGRPLWLPARPEPPVISWLHVPEFQTGDAVEPNVGKPGITRFEFKVRVSDADGDTPEYCRLILRKDGQNWRTLTMHPEGSSPSMITGVTYAHKLSKPLPPGRYAFRFRAKDEDGFATGPPTEFQPGPRFVPKLAFSGAPGMDDGVKPNGGTAGETPFVFRVLYEDYDGDAAKSVRVVLRRDGKYGRTLTMLPKGDGGDAARGTPYVCRRKLAAGEYQYRFTAEDKDGEAIGKPTTFQGGLTVTSGAASLALTGLAAAPTDTGAQITFVLAGDAQIEARVLNLAGRPVGTICRARDCAAGTSTLVWSGRSDAGLSAPNGTYLVEVSAKTPDGTQTRALAQVRLSR